MLPRAWSVSSSRRMNVPPMWRANSRLKSAVRAVPMCNGPVGLGAIRTRIGAGEVTSAIVGAARPPALSARDPPEEALVVAHETIVVRRDREGCAVGGAKAVAGLVTLAGQGRQAVIALRRCGDRQGRNVDPGDGEVGRG